MNWETYLHIPKSKWETKKFKSFYLLHYCVEFCCYCCCNHTRRTYAYTHKHKSVYILIMDQLTHEWSKYHKYNHVVEKSMNFNYVISIYHNSGNFFIFIIFLEKANSSNWLTLKSIKWNLSPNYDVFLFTNMCYLWKKFIEKNVCFFCQINWQKMTLEELIGHGVKWCWTDDWNHRIAIMSSTIEHFSYNHPKS